MKKLTEKKLNLSAQTIAQLNTKDLLQAAGGKWREGSLGPDNCGTRLGC